MGRVLKFGLHLIHFHFDWFSVILCLNAHELLAFVYIFVECRPTTSLMTCHHCVSFTVALVICKLQRILKGFTSIVAQRVFYLQRSYCLHHKTRAKKWRPLRTIVSEITTAIYSDMQSAHGFRFCDGSKFAISHWLGRSLLIQSWRYCAACDYTISYQQPT